ncbi:MAG: cobalt-zinc-cadmium efflux system protein [Candidatus Methanomethylophilaceae archaeon]|nr:cobalt-zinc-cadmium efflux system protein [Candidatus Methanomethylophilaceae archaeon]HIJ00002.1 cation transporter [Candidatus Methanomethylophilaceae archaeon]
MVEENTHRRSRRLLWSILLNVVITLAQIIGGIISGSLALISDALHNLSDVAALMMSWVAARLRSHECTPDKTFGYKRAELMAALINGLILFAISFYLIFEAIERLSHPQSIDGVFMLVLGGLAVIVNGGCAMLLHADSRKNLNMRSAYLHLVTDMVTSVTVMLGGVAVMFLGLNWVDSVITIIVSLALMYFAGRLILDAMRVFMQFAPPDLDIFAIENTVQSIDGIEGMHHIHVWQLSENETHLEAHVSLSNDLPVSQADELMTCVEAKLRDEYGINHVTLRPEHRPNCDQELVVRDPDREHNHIENDK